MWMITDPSAAPKLVILVKHLHRDVYLGTFLSGIYKRMFLYSVSFKLQEVPAIDSKGVMSKFLAVLGGAKEEVEEGAPTEPVVLDPADKFKKVLVETIVRWASESFIETPVLIREMFRYNSIRQYLLSM